MFVPAQTSGFANFFFKTSSTPLAIDPNSAMQENLQAQRQLQIELAVFDATEIPRFTLELRPDDTLCMLHANHG